LEKFIADNLPYGVIFEDDVILGHGAQDILGEARWLSPFVDKAGEIIDVIKLETSGKKVWLGPNLPLEGQDQAGFGLAAIKTTHILAAAYLISRHAAIHLLELMRCKAAPFDHFLFNFSLGIAQEFTLYQLDPAIAIQAKFVSTLESERAKDKIAAKASRRFDQTLVRETRRLIRRTRTGLWGIKTNLFTQDQWKRVPYTNTIKERIK